MRVFRAGCGKNCAYQGSSGEKGYKILLLRGNKNKEELNSREELHLS